MGRVQILLDVDVDLSDRDVLLVEDIVDTGLTLSYLLSILGPAVPRRSSSARCSTSRSEDRAPHPSLRRVRLPG